MDNTTLNNTLITNNYVLLKANKYYTKYSNNQHQIIYIYSDLKSESLTLLNTSNFIYTSDIEMIVSFINHSYNKTNNQVIEELINPLDQLIPLSKNDFEKLILLVVGNSKTISSYLVYESEIDKLFPNLILLDDTLEKNKGKNAYIFNENNYQLIFRNDNYYKFINPDNKNFFITSNPYLFSMFNLNEDKNSILFPFSIASKNIFKTIAKKVNENIKEISIGYLLNLNDLIFTSKFLIEYFNYTQQYIFEIDIKENETIISFPLDTNDFEKYNDNLVLFAGLIMPLNKKISSLNIPDESQFKMDSYKFSSFSIKQIIFPNKVEFFEAFIKVFTRHFKLNDITFYNDLSFAEEEENTGMFQIVGE